MRLLIGMTYFTVLICGVPIFLQKYGEERTSLYQRPRKLMVFLNPKANNTYVTQASYEVFTEEIKGGSLFRLLVKCSTSQMILSKRTYSTAVAILPGLKQLLLSLVTAGRKLEEILYHLVLCVKHLLETAQRAGLSQLFAPCKNT